MKAKLHLRGGEGIPRTFRFILFIVLGFALPVTLETTPKNIFLLAGQSNMSGRGGVKKHANGTISWDRVVPPECQPDPSIRRLDANLTWVLAKEPLHEGIDDKTINGIGSGMPFAHEVLKLKPDYGTIGLVPCALGGSSINRWQRGMALYDRLMLRANASIQGGGKIQGLLWQQGGTDSFTFEGASAYKPKLSKFFNDLREDLNSPDLIIMQIAIAPGKRAYTNIVRGAQFTMDDDDPNIRTVDSAKIPVEYDNVHLTTQGQIQLGKILASTFLEPPLNKTSVPKE